MNRCCVSPWALAAVCTGRLLVCAGKRRNKNTVILRMHILKMGPLLCLGRGSRLSAWPDEPQIRALVLARHSRNLVP